MNITYTKVFLLDAPHGFNLLTLIPSSLELCLVDSVNRPKESDKSQAHVHGHVYSELLKLGV